MEQKKPKFNVSDLKGFEYSIVLENTVTQTQILESSKIKIIEFIEKGMRLQMPQNAGAQGHNILLYIYPNISGKTVKCLPKEQKTNGLIQITAKVLSVESDAKPGKALYSIEFIQFTEKEWASFYKKFQTLQQQADKIFKVIKD